MADAFDTYHKWLGIPPAEQPPTHYRLLGITRFEEDLDVIEAAADRVMAQLRTHQSGKYSAQSQKLLNEVAAAHLCLMTAAQKQKYDRALRVATAPAAPPQTASRPAANPAAFAPSVVVPATPRAASAPRQAAPSAVTAADRFEPISTGPNASRRSAAKSSRRLPLGVQLAAVAVVLVLAVAGAAILLSRPAPQPVATAHGGPGRTAGAASEQKRAAGRDAEGADSDPAKSDEPTDPAAGADVRSRDKNGQGDQRAHGSRDNHARSAGGMQQADDDPPTEETDADEPATDKTAGKTTTAKTTADKLPPDEATIDETTDEASIEESTTDEPADGASATARGDASQPAAGPAVVVVTRPDAADVPVPREAAQPEPPRNKPAQPPARPRAPAGPKLQPVPDDEAQRAARQLVRQIHQKEVEQAKKPAQKQELARAVLKEALATKDDPVARYVLLAMAQDLAAGASDVELLSAVVDATANSFDVDRIGTKAEALIKLSTGGGKVSADALTVALDALAGQAIAADRFELAWQLAEATVAASKKSRDKALAKQIVARRKEIGELHKAYAAAKSAIDNTAQGAGDAADCLAAGRFLAFYKKDWPAALPLLARGSEPALAELAALDQSAPAAAGERLKLADGWWALAEKESGLAQKRMQSRAVHWYELCAAELTGLTKTKVAQRLEGFDGERDDDTAGPPRETARLMLASNAGLAWIARQQLPDGSWSFSTDGESVNHKEPAVATSLALLPLLRGGHSQQKGEHSKTVKRGLAFIQSRLTLENNGAYVRNSDCNMYGQALIAMTLCEALARGKDDSLRRAAQSTIDYIVAAQDPNGGGWRYQPHERGDTSVAGWQLQALRLASRAKLRVPPQTIELANRYLDSAQTGSGSSYGYEPGTAATLPMTAAGLFARTCAGSQGQSTGFGTGVERVGAAGPSKQGSRNLYYDYYGTLLMRTVGGPGWQKWCEAEEQELLEKQETHGPQAGSWPGPDMWSSSLGRLGMTSFSLLILNELQHGGPERGSRSAAP